MMKAPTYTAQQIKEMVANPDMDQEGFRILAELISEEIGLYEPHELPTLTHASFILFNRSLLSGWTRNLK